MRQPLPTGTKISGYGEIAEVVRDDGGKMLRVRVTREENWHYSWRGNDIQVVEEVKTNNKTNLLAQALRFLGKDLACMDKTEAMECADLIDDIKEELG